MRRPKKTAPAPIEPVYQETFVGYARVSTEEQNLDMQVEALKRAGVHPDNIYTEHVSGVAKRRPGRDIALKACRPGDTFTVWKLDRVGRSLMDLLHFMDKLERAGVNFKSLQDSIDTATPAGRAMFHLLGVFAQFERDLIAERTQAGVDRAKERGVKFGAPPKITPEREAEIEKLIADGWTIREIAEKYEVAVATIRNRFNRHRLETIRSRAKRKRK